jgi:hypothetical protein
MTNSSVLEQCFSIFINSTISNYTVVNSSSTQVNLTLVFSIGNIYEILLIINSSLLAPSDGSSLVNSTYTNEINTQVSSGGVSKLPVGQISSIL